MSSSKVTEYLKSHPGKTAREVRKNLSRYTVTTDEIRKVAAAIGYRFPDDPAAPDPSPAPPEDRSISGGVLIGTKRVMSHKPATSTRVTLRRLPKGRAFLIKELAGRIGVSVETLRRHASDLGCLRYLEVAPDDWQQVVMNPETAQKYVSEF